MIKAKKRSGRKCGAKASQDVERAMHQMKRGALRSGGSGKKVTSRKQAVAIGRSEARREGAKVPRAIAVRPGSIRGNRVSERRDDVELQIRNGAVVDLDVRGRPRPAVSVVEGLRREVELPVPIVDRLWVVGRVRRSRRCVGPHEEGNKSRGGTCHPPPDAQAAGRQRFFVRRDGLAVFLADRAARQPLEDPPLHLPAEVPPVAIAAPGVEPHSDPAVGLP